MQIEVEVEEVVTETVMKEMLREVYEDVYDAQVQTVHDYQAPYGNNFFAGEYLFLIKNRPDGWLHVR